MSLFEASPGSEKSTKSPTLRAQLAAFVVDGQSEAILRECILQLGMQNSVVMRGGIAKAVKYLATERSPHVLIVDISGVNLAMTEVQNLAEVCEPGVTVLVLGEHNDIGLYRDLLQSGISDYIVKPLTPYLVARSMQAAIEGRQPNRISQKLAKLVTFVGVRGGVGTTTLATNMAWYLANTQKRRVALIDMDLQTGDSSMMLNIKPAPGLREALENPLRIDNIFIERAMTAVSEHLFVLCAEEPLREEMQFTPDAVDALLAVVRGQFHYVVVDVPRIPSAAYRRLMELADVRVIIADQTLRSVRDAVRWRATLGEDESAHRNVFVVNRSGEGGGRAVTVQEMGDALELRPKTVVPYLPKLFATATSKAELPVNTRGAFAEAITSLAQDISGRTPARRRRWGLWK
jgi:pilus assembly protein CpaE